ncbi:DUF3575 domain-containing protein [Myxococcus sp. CA040A]|uniref:DUF3575 domain-containing protein n=1 Tax=Myxococcus sp. CA040A TaxID=2741738 RepID=UPI00157AD89F|nr:DUF3575 domain-containing protein [Myxococcus sp. CA040A]NTX05800.1 DUF3575 domain-containing protein [Myxococcus sp. CA040A]
MIFHIRRLVILTALFVIPGQAFAQEDDTSGQPLLIEDTRQDTASWGTALHFGLHGHSFEMDEGPTRTPVFMVNMEQQLQPALTVFGGTHLGLDINAVGLQLGSRIYFSQQSFLGVFVSAQASHTLFDLDENTEGTRTSLSGLVGYAHPFGDRWHLSVSAGAQTTHTRTETTREVTRCFLMICETTDVLEKVEEQEAVEPLVQMAATFRF